MTVNASQSKTNSNEGNNVNRKSGFLILMTVMLSFCGSAYASKIGSSGQSGISGLYNTGVDNSSNVLANGSQDSHYSLVSNGADSSGKPLPSGTTTPYAYSSGWPISSEPSNGTTGRWIGPDNASSWITLFSPAQGGPGVSLDPTVTGIYTFTTSFTIDNGFNLNTASISGLWAVDNYAQMFLNGKLVATIDNPRSSGLADGLAYDRWNAFTIDGANANDFVSGTNLLTFNIFNIAQNGGNPMALRVEFTNSTISPVPEPQTYAMLLAGLGLLGFIVYRRKNDSSNMPMAA
jgi:hypothetical protein